MIPLFKVAMSERASAAVAGVLASGHIGQGAKVEEFEDALRERLGTRFVSTVNSGTSGLQLALKLAARNGGEVLSTPLTFVATNWAILAAGLPIRWVDVDPATLNADLSDMAAKVSARTAAIVVVHWAGYPVDLARVAEIADECEHRHGTRPMIIEDCAQAWGATYAGRPLGNHGNVAVYSFQAIKQVTSGDGGLLVCPDEESHRRGRLIRWFGLDRDPGATPRSEQDVSEWGLKFHMNDISAAIGLANLEGAEERVGRHRSNAAYYDRELKDVQGLERVRPAPGSEPSYWVYPVKVKRRDDFVAHLQAAGIAAGHIDARNDRHSCVAEYAEPLPKLDAVHDQIVCLPVGWWLSEQDREHIVNTIRNGW
ncbi:aminotransferase DegT [Spongiactinospora gelatinilytica]|uniref:Aminotransferase DegT n=1 Tax=Spongiactinospora gelatinilytica TaxID=2666298 RepID=A0A2W2GPC7_9ACTN|nr:DegT/DnrJ/EryC1/StrS family aminotransferase [Spongiactinospora gelatinilytica]PZG51386.1 aminotransferase DegT [Spongiactinospora gelatinilytica]